ncbi:hypothetical protein A3H04_04600 [Candidatus Giovannonibacteria bacterium RIFCSPLOWO2_12_FULL_43_11c]|uniref:Uncharacterized protein n=1 Tax=Candidatus Giovannonibacteria bacterium RIFCSPHIGHO2_12_FULL_43_15 TaxID=1798341 RepID=A0A1F5WNY2_9BACT|nr:MAG: hypothetical protein A3F23_03745 [Candidatus Giovannonibacteria bacterium RIFCSPHIGHO2_12_FULL_43_15]OGF91995.1 MAG: hypothetical protein A3H04_04600 [Candidatus Giovannonibacteria bacterium RIFCSPLOWO2_12_FULL_43_11c]
MAKKIMTIEALARITQNEFSGLRKAINDGFENTPSKGDLWEIQADIRHGFKQVGEDIKEVKVVLPPTLRAVGKLELDVKEITKRLERVERKVGLGK